MTETQRAAMQAAEDAFRRESDYYAMTGKETKARENIALAGKMAAALAEPEPADEQIGWLYTSATSLRKKYIGHRDDLPDALRDLDPMPVYARPQRREPLTDAEWLDYVLRHGTKTDVHIATYEGIATVGPMGKVIRLQTDANNLRKLVEKAHGIGAKP